MGKNLLYRTAKFCIISCYSLIFWNHLITFTVFCHSFMLNLLSNSVFIWSKMCLLILLISFLDQFMSLVVGWFAKFSLWSFKVKMELPVPLISILPNISACFANLTPSLLIFVPMFFFVLFL